LPDAPVDPSSDRAVAGRAFAGRTFSELAFADLVGDDRRWGSAFPVLVQLRTHLDRPLFDAILAAAAPQGLTYTAALIDDRCVGLAGWRVIDTTHVVRKLYVDDLVTDTAHRSRGIGAALLDHLEARGAVLGCRFLELDSGVQREAAHRFYRRQRMRDDSLHFRRPIAPADGPDATT
jgi:GNAT superfamily N-acetyltransferase